MGTGQGWPQEKTDELKSVVEPLRVGHGLLSREQFVKQLMAGDLEIWRLPHNAYALIAWGDSEHGLTCNILTTCGDASIAKHVDDGLKAIERIAKEKGARMVISAGRPGYRAVALANGYTVQPLILMKKVLTDD